MTAQRPTSTCCCETNAIRRQFVKPMATVTSSRMQRAGVRLFVAGSLWALNIYLSDAWPTILPFLMMVAGYLLLLLNALLTRDS